MIMIIPLKPDCGTAAVLVKSNTTYRCNDLLNGSRIGEDLKWELEFFTGSNVIRFLQDANRKLSLQALNPYPHFQYKWPNGKPYGHCTALGNIKSDCKGIYKRGCKKPAGQNN